MPAQPAAIELLAALAAVLGPRRWYLFEAQAVNVYGRPRMTADVDVTVEIARAELPALVRAMKTAGFTVRVSDPDAFLKVTSVIPFVHAATGMPLDVVIAASGLEDLFLSGARPTDIGGLVVPVISPGHLVVTKILAARPKDLDDAASVIAERLDDLDLDEIRTLLADIEHAVGQSDLTPALDAALGARATTPPGKRRAKRRPKPR